MSPEWKRIATIAAVAIGGLKGAEYGAPAVAGLVQGYFRPAEPETCWRFSLEVVDGKIVSNALAINVSNGIPTPQPKPQPEPEPIPPAPPVEPKPSEPIPPRPVNPAPKPIDPPPQPTPPPIPPPTFGVRDAVYKAVLEIQSAKRADEARQLAADLGAICDRIDAGQLTAEDAIASQIVDALAKLPPAWRPFTRASRGLVYPLWQAGKLKSSAAWSALGREIAGAVLDASKVTP